MRTFILLLLLISSPVLAVPAEVWCWSENKLIFHKHVITAYQTKENLIAVTQKETYVLYNGDCLIMYQTKDLPRKSKH